MHLEDDRPFADVLPLRRQRFAWTVEAPLWLQRVLPIWRGAVLPYLGTRCMILVVELLANSYLLVALQPHVGAPRLRPNTRFPDLLWQNWQHFDGGFYLQLAVGGYPTAPPHKPFAVWEFYPLYPLLIHPLGQLFGGTWSWYSIAGLVVSNLAALVAIVYLFLLVRREFGEGVARRTVIFLSVFPASYFLSAIYSESVFLATAVACLYYARERHWLLAGLMGGLATLARGPGILLLVPVGWEYWAALSDEEEPWAALSETRRERLWRWWVAHLDGLRRAARSGRAWLSLLALSLIPLGQLLFMAYAQLQCGDFFANLTAAHLWGHTLTWPWSEVFHDLIQHPPPTTPWTDNLFVLSWALLLLFVGFTIWAFCRLPATYGLYALALLLPPLTSGYITSLPRYFLPIFPAYILLARWADPHRHLTRYTFIVGMCTTLLAVLAIFFELGMQVSGA